MPELTHGLTSTPFKSEFLAGFECSTHRRRDGRRLDLLALTQHDRFVERDYAELARLGIRTVRDGVRWHRVEQVPNHYDWSSFLPMLQAARLSGMQAIWDLCHYGWPDDLSIWSSSFPERFARFAGAAARVVCDETGPGGFYCPVNEISFWAWAGGEVGRFNPCTHGRGNELKRQLVRAAIAATDAIRSVDPQARFVTAEPVIHVDPGLGDEAHWQAAERYREIQFEATDMLAGRLEPELGGAPDLLDIVGLNFYPDNQWYHGGGTIPLGHHAYRSLRHMLAEAAARYARPIFIAETGAEGSARGAWLHYMCQEVVAARGAGIDVAGICLYPVLDYPGWDNGRTCRVGLFSEADDEGHRELCPELAAVLRRQQRRFRAEQCEPVRAGAVGH